MRVHLCVLVYPWTAVIGVLNRSICAVFLMPVPLYPPQYQQEKQRFDQGYIGK